MNELKNERKQERNKETKTERKKERKKEKKPKHEETKKETNGYWRSLHSIKIQLVFFPFQLLPQVQVLKTTIPQSTSKS